jgi:hypothetical protein
MPPSPHTPQDHRLHAPATLRNRGPILEVLRRVLPQSGLVLEVAAGSGEHAVFFAEAFPHLTWQPSDGDDRAMASIAAWRSEAALPNLRPPVQLDAAAPQWPVAHADAIVCVNMIHIAPWEACVGLMAGAGRILPERGPLYLYGPFMEHGAHTSESNRAFDADLRARNRRWGVRNLDDVIALAAEHGIAYAETVRMPANNLSVIFRRGG